MDNVLLSLGGLVIYKSAALISLTVLLASLLILGLYRSRSVSAAPIAALLPLAFALSLFFARLLHWYFTAYAYSGGFIQALTDPYAGSFALPGVVLGLWLAARLVHRMGLAKTSGLLLDCTAPALPLLAAGIRLSCFFTGTCIGNRNLESPLLQWSPLAVAVSDAAGNVSYRLRVYFLEALLMLLLAALAYGLLRRWLGRRMYAPCARLGNIWRITLSLYACVEIFTDSLRRDSILMRFRFLHALNPYSSFISLAQVFAGVLLLCVFVYYLRCSIRIYGFDGSCALSIGLFVLGLVLIGGAGEFLIQRYGSKVFLLPVRLWGYLSMLLGCALIVRILLRLYGDCVRETG